MRIIDSVEVQPAGGAYELALQVRGAPVRVLRGGADSLLVEFSQSASGVRIDILTTGSATDADVALARTAARGIAGLDDDPTDFLELARRHAVLAPLSVRFRGARLTRAPRVFDAFVATVIEQLVTGFESGRSIKLVRMRWGEPVPGTGLRAFPLPEALARASVHDLRRAGIGLRKATLLRRGAILAPRLEALRQRDPEDAVRALTSIPGIGIWSASSIAIRALGYADGVLVDDAVIPWMMTALLTGVPGKNAEMLACLEPFRPHRGRVLRLLEVAWSRGALPEHARPRRVPDIDPHRRYLD